MNVIEIPIAHSLGGAATIGWALLNFVWQGAAIAQLLKLTLSILPRSASSERYVAGCIALVLMLAFPILPGEGCQCPMASGTGRISRH